MTLHSMGTWKFREGVLDSIEGIFNSNLVIAKHPIGVLEWLTWLTPRRIVGD